jgi:orotate phosphoribosyltransferase
VTDPTQSRTRLARLLADNAVIHESVVLSSGRRSPYYVDCRQVLLDPEGAELAGALSWDLLKDAGVDAVGGLTLGADPLVCATSAAAWSAGRRVTGFFIRKEAKKHGLQQWVEGPFIEEGTPVAIVDDVLTSGGSLATAVEKARQAGGVVVAAIVVIDREEGGREAIEALLDGAPLHALFTAKELLNADS